MSQPEMQHRLASDRLSTRPAHVKWDREALRGLVYANTGRGIQKHWLWTTGRAEDSRYRRGIAQNAVHLLCYPLVGDWRRRVHVLEEVERDPEWYREVVGHLRQ